MDSRLYKAAATERIKYFEDASESEWNELWQMKSRQGNTILHIAVKYKKSLLAKKIMSKCRSLVNEQNLNGDSPLHVAAREKSGIKMVELLIECLKGEEDEANRKAAIRMANIKGNTALHEAVRSNNLKAVELLIGEDEELASISNNEGDSPLFMAVDFKFYKISRHILKAAPKCSYKGRLGMNVLHASIIQSEETLLYRYLYPLTRWLFVISLALGILFPLWFIVAFLIGGCMYLFKWNRFKTIGSDFMQKVHERYPSAISEADEFGWIPLHYAAYMGNLQVVKQLLQLDNSEPLLEMRDNEGMSALHMAAKGSQNFVVINLIANYPYTKEHIDNTGRNVLHVAAEAGSVNIVEFSSRQSFFADLVNEEDINGNTPLHLASLREHQKIFEKLISCSVVNLRATNKAGLTALDIIRSKDKSSLQELSQGIKCLEDFVSRQNTGKDREVEQIRQEESSSGSHKAGEAPELHKELANINLLIVTIVATVTFAAGIAVPGGFISDDEANAAGTAILTKQAAFQAFVMANSVAFGFSSALMTLRFWFALSKKEENASRILDWSIFFRNLAVLAMVVAFLSGVYVVLDNTHGLAVVAVVFGCLAFITPAVMIEIFDRTYMVLDF